MKLSLVFQLALLCLTLGHGVSTTSIRAAQGANEHLTSFYEEYLNDPTGRRLTVFPPSEAKVKKDIADFIKKNHKGDICKAFDAFDKNKDKKLDKNELKAALDKIADEQNEDGDDWGNWAGEVADKVLNGKKTITKEKLKSSAEKDPRFMNFSGRVFEYHGECDLVLMKHPAFYGALGLDIHTRTQHKLLGDAYVAFNSKVAVRVGSDVFEVQGDGTYFLNGVENVSLVPPPAIGGGNHTIVPSTNQFCLESTNGDEWCVDSINFNVTLDAGPATPFIGYDQIYIRTYKGMVHVYVEATEDNLSGCTGMLGTWNTFGERGMVARDGVTKIINDANSFSQEWQFNPDLDGPMLFQDSRGPQLPTAQCLPPPEFPARRNLRYMNNAGEVTGYH